MPQHLDRPHIHLPRRGLISAFQGSKPQASTPSPPADAQRWQVLKDKLAVAAVLLLVLATITVFVLYVVQQAPHWKAGELTGFATPMPEVTAQAGAGETNVQTAAGGLGRIPLILISTVVEMGIFVALGLYLRHDMQRKR
jgi:hypothetical protein